MNMLKLLMVPALVLGLVSPAIGQVEFAEEATAAPEKPYSPHVGRKIPRRVYWGDTHLHRQPFLPHQEWQKP